MHNVLFLLAAALYVSAVVQLRRAWRHPSGEGVAFGSGRRWLLVGPAARAHYFTPAGQRFLRRSRWLFGATWVLGILWLIMSALHVGN
jgi:hypothetical protein